MALELAAPPSWVCRLDVDEPVELEGVELEDVDDEGELLHPATSPAIMASAEPAVTYLSRLHGLATFLHQSEAACMMSTTRRLVSRRPAGMRDHPAACPCARQERSRSCGPSEWDRLDGLLGGLGCPFRVVVVNENGGIDGEAHPRVAAGLQHAPGGPRLGRAYHDLCAGRLDEVLNAPARVGAGADHAGNRGGRRLARASPASRSRARRPGPPARPRCRARE